MVSPNLIRSQEKTEPVEINENTKKLFQIVYSEKNSPEDKDDGIPKIKVSSLVSRLAFFYEKVRNAVDYEEEHLLRKNAIARILRRQVVIEGVVKDIDSKYLANHLLVELIRGSYLPNNKVPESKIKEVSALLEKYIKLKDFFVAKINANLNLKSDINKVKDLINEKNFLINWLLHLAACEIEENLSPNKVKQAIVSSMFDVLVKNLKLPDGSPFEKDLEIQIYLSISRKFLKFDEDMLSFVLFKYYNKSWFELSKDEIISEEDDKKIQKIASHFHELYSLIKGQINHPIAKQLDQITRLYSLYFHVLSETIENDPVRVYSELQENSKTFVKQVRKICNNKYGRVKSRLWRAALRSIIYIFLTKSIFVVLIEIPAIKWFNEPLNVMSLTINIIFPAFLLFLIVFTTRRPGHENTDKIVEGIKEIAFVGEEKRQPIVIRQKTGRNLVVNGIFHLIYTASFCFSIYLIIKALTFIGFNWVSITIFLFFLAFVSFFSILVTRGVKELLVIERKENLFTFIVDLFYMPIILVGRWLSRNVSKVNVFIFIFDFIIEAPFKILVEIAEDWTKYVRERRDNME